MKVTVFNLESLLLFCCLLVSSSVVVADSLPFDRVFTTSAERDVIDSQRKSLLSGAVNVSGSVENTSNVIVQHRSNLFVLNGVVLRSDGKNNVWVNGKSVLSEDAEEHLENTSLVKQERADNTVRLIYEDKYRTIKPGQVWLFDKGEVKELHELKVNKPAGVGKTEAASTIETQSAIQQSIQDIQKFQSLAN